MCISTYACVGITPGLLITTTCSFPKEGGVWVDLGGIGQGCVEEEQRWGQRQKSELRDQLDEYILFWFFCEMTDFYLYFGKLHQTCQTPSFQMCT